MKASINPKAVAASNKPASSFIDAYGATVCIPAGEGFNYMAIMAEQLQAVTLLLTQAEVGAVDLGATRQTFQVMANELAGHVAALIEMVALEAAAEGQKGDSK